MNRDDRSVGRVVEFLRSWALPSAVALVSATAYGVREQERNQSHIERLEKTTSELRVDVDRLRAGGSDGLLDPTAHGILDQHIRHFMERELGSRGFRRLVNQFSDAELDR